MGSKISFSPEFHSSFLTAKTLRLKLIHFATTENENKASWHRLKAETKNNKETTTATACVTKRQKGSFFCLSCSSIINSYFPMAHSPSCLPFFVFKSVLASIAANTAAFNHFFPIKVFNKLSAKQWEEHGSRRSCKKVCRLIQNGVVAGACLR